MRFSSLNALVTHEVAKKANGPVAAIIAEDDVEIAATVQHHITRGFKTIFLFAPSELVLLDACDADVHRIDFPTLQENATFEIVNALNNALPTNTWLYYCYNSEFLFHPFCETRSVGELLAFHAEERRFGMLTYVVDAYAGDLALAENAVALDNAFLDKSGYYSLSRSGDDGPKERQLNFHGGLRWRFEEHIEEERRKIDRIALVRTDPGIEFRGDHTWSDEERNTYSCPWHNNLTAAIISFRTAKALCNNPASKYDIKTFRWQNSVPFEWKSQQLLDLGLMEPGQWF